jgi:hypothetical protein
MKRHNWPLFLLSVVLLYVATVNAQEKEQGALTVEVLKEIGAQSEAQARVYAENTQTPVATAKLGEPVNLPSGSYRVELDVLGGKVSRDHILVKSGRTSTVFINEVAGLQVNVLDKKGKDLGLAIEVFDSTSGQKLGDFLSGETILAYPGAVDVKVAVPPQSQWVRKIELQRSAVARFDFKERVRGQLLVRPLLNGQDVSTNTQVIIYEAGTQKEISRSEPGPEHKFELETGTYDIFVTNSTGKGRPFVQDHAEITGEEKVEKKIPLDGENAPGASPKMETL